MQNSTVVWFDGKLTVSHLESHYLCFSFIDCDEFDNSHLYVLLKPAACHSIPFLNYSLWLFDFNICSMGAVHQILHFGKTLDIICQSHVIFGCQSIAVS